MGVIWTLFNWRKTSTRNVNFLEENYKCQSPQSPRRKGQKWENRHWKVMLDVRCMPNILVFHQTIENFDRNHLAAHLLIICCLRNIYTK